MPLVGAAVVAGVATVYGAHKQASAATKAAKTTSDAANHAADVQAASDAERLTFERQTAENAYANSETTRRANYDQWASRQRILQDLYRSRGWGDLTIPAYVPGVDPKFNAPTAAETTRATQAATQANYDRSPLGAHPGVGSVQTYLPPMGAGAPPPTAPGTPPPGSVASYVAPGGRSPAPRVAIAPGVVQPDPYALGSVGSYLRY